MNWRFVVLFIKLIAGLGFGLLVGCSSAPDVKDAHLTDMVEKQSSEEKKVVETPTAISPEVLYLLMTAEIAGQRDRYDIALEGYLQAAKKVKDPKIAERAAKIGLYVKNTKKTDEAIALWLKQDGNNLTARKIAVLSALRGSDKALAVSHLNALLKNDPAGFESTLLELTKVLEQEANTVFVFDALEEVANQHQDRAVVFFVQSLLASQQNKRDVAGQKVNKAIELQPNWNKALILRAQLAVQKEDFNLAVDDLNKVLKKTPENKRVKSMLGQVLVRAEKFAEAIGVYQDILKADPENGDALFSIALIYLQQKKEDKAVDYLNKLVNKPKWNTPASFYLGRVEYSKKNYAQALTWFDKANTGPYAYDAAVAAVSLQLSEKNYVDAERRIEKVEANFPKQKLNILMLKAEVFNVQKQHQKAYDILTNALKNNPDHVDLLYTRALIAEKIGKLEVLEEDLKKILLKDPNDANTLNALGYTLADRTERYKEAETYLQKAIKLKPEEAVIIDSIGWLKYKQGKLEESLVHLKNAYKKQPESEIAAHLAEVLLVMGRKQEAKILFDKALSESPEDEYLLKVQHLFK